MLDRKLLQKVLHRTMGKEEERENTEQTRSAGTDDNPQRAALRNALKRLLDSV